MTGEVFSVPTAPNGPWEQISSNERTWIEFIRVISCGSDPRLSVEMVRKLTDLLAPAEEDAQRL